MEEKKKTKKKEEKIDLSQTSWGQGYFSGDGIEAACNIREIDNSSPDYGWGR